MTKRGEQRESLFDRIKRWNRRSGPGITIQRKVSELVFKNSAGWTNNTEGKRLLEAARASAALPVAQTPEAKAFWAEGFVRPPWRIDVSKAYDFYNSVIEDAELSKGRSSHKFSRMIPDATRFDVFSCLVDDRLRNLLSGIYGAHAAVVGLLPYRIRHAPESVVRKNKEIFSNFWHFDWQSTAQVRMFVLLSDTDEKNGPLMINSLERSKALLRQGKWRGRDDHDITECDREAVKFTGKAGDIFLCRTTVCLHRASIPQEGRIRDMVSLSFMPSDRPLAQDWLSTVRPAK